jgi:hypothetical protein
VKKIVLKDRNSRDLRTDHWLGKNDFFTLISYHSHNNFSGTPPTTRTEIMIFKNIPVARMV